MPWSSRTTQRSNSTSAAVGMIIVLLGVSVFVPSLFVNLENPQTTTYTQFEAERVIITGDVSTQVTSISNQDVVNITVVDRVDDEFAATGELGEGESATLTVSGEDMNVTVLDVFGGYGVVVTYEYPLYIGWPAGANVIVEESPLFITLSGVMLFVGVILLIFRGEV